MRIVQEVRRHRVVPALELPHHGGVATVPVLREEAVLVVDRGVGERDGLAEDFWYPRRCPSDLSVWSIDAIRKMASRGYPMQST